MLKTDSLNYLKSPGIAIIGLFAIYICVKYSSVLLGLKGVSRLSKLAEWDSVFQQYSTGQTGAYDPSLVQLLVPNYFLVGQMWHQLQLPAWNSHSGFGMPLIADVQSCAFSLLHLPLAIAPSTYIYNCILLLQIVIAFAGTYTLARLFKLDLFTSSIAAFLYAQNPYILYYMELLSGTSSILLPGLLAAFVYAAKSNTAKSMALCSLACAIYVLAGHPESSLFGIAIGSMLYLVWPENHSWRQRIIALAFIATTSMGLAAPMLLPLSEYLRIGDSYKYAGDMSAFAPWQGLVLNMISPCSKAASPYLSLMALWGLSLLATGGTKNRLGKTLAWVALAMGLICLAWIARLGFLHDLLKISWLNYVITIYLIPTYLLMLILAASAGIQNFLHMTSATRQIRATMILLGLVCLSWLIVFCYQNQDALLASYNFDGTLGTLAFDGRALQIQSLIHIGACIAILICSRKSPGGRRHKRIIASSIIAATTILSLSTANTRSLPLQPAFAFAQTQTIDFLSKNRGRTLSLVEHVLKPNYNIVYGIDCVRVHNPLMPARFARWSQACGADLDVFRNQTYSYQNLTAAIDLSGIKYLVNQFTDLPAPYSCIFTTNEGIKIFENPKALPQTYYCAKIKLHTDGEAALKDLELRKYKIDDGVVIETSVLSKSLKSLLEDMQRSQANAKDQIIAAQNLNFSETSGYIQEFHSAFDRPKLLIISNTYYPGWQATIDGKPAEIMHANYMFQAIYIPAGAHQISVAFSSDNLRYGLIAAAAALSGC